jgi:Flp pilus assembly protein TadG
MRASCIQSGKKQTCRDGAAAVELATLLPILIFCSMAVVDFARVVYVEVTLQSCARNGAMYEFYSATGMSIPSGWTSLSAAASADALSGMTVSATATSPGLASSNHVTVTATTTFKLISLAAFGQLPALPGSMTLSQTATLPYPASTSTVY